MTYFIIRYVVKENQASLHIAPGIGKARPQNIRPRAGNKLPTRTSLALPTSQASFARLLLRKLIIDRYTFRNPPFYQAQQLKRASTMSRRALTIGGLVVAGAAGYYLYTAGGDPKVAQKNFEGMELGVPSFSIPLLTRLTTADASKASAKLKSEVPGKTKEVEKKGEAYAQSAGSKLDSAVRAATRL